MIKKTVKYKDFNGDDAEDDLYFHLTEAEIVEMEVKYKGISEWVARVTKSEDAQEIYKEFKWLLVLAYGQRSEDGKRFVKNDQIREEFVSSQAFSDLIMELLNDTDKALEFFRGMVPTNIQKAAAKLEAAATPPEPVVPEDIDAEPPVVPAVRVEPEVVTTQQIQAMSREEFLEYQQRMQRGEVVLKDD